MSEFFSTAERLGQDPGRMSLEMYRAACRRAAAECADAIREARRHAIPHTDKFDDLPEDKQCQWPGCARFACIDGPFCALHEKRAHIGSEDIID